MSDFSYDVNPVVHMVQKWLAELREKTGRSAGQWVELVKSQGPKSEAERSAWLKAEFGLPTFSAKWIAELCDGKGVEHHSPEAYLKAAPDWVEGMFAGKKAHLKPIYDHLLPIVKGLDSDVRICPCRTIVPFYRNHVFAQVKPTTNSRIDLGFALGSTPAAGRLIDTGGFAKKDRITHRIALSSLKDIDDEVLRWLRTAYERDA